MKDVNKFKTFANAFEEICLMLDLDNKLISYNAVKRLEILRIRMQNRIWYSKLNINFKNQYMSLQSWNFMTSQDFGISSEMRHLFHLQFTDHGRTYIRETVNELKQTLTRCKFLFALQVDGEYFSKYIYGNHQVTSVLTRRVVKNVNKYVKNKQSKSKAMQDKSKSIFSENFTFLLGKEKLSNMVCKRLCTECNAYKAIFKAVAQSNS